MADVIAMLVSFAVTRALVFAVVLMDERRLPEERLARAWPPASRDCAIVMFGALALALHVGRTRRSVAGALLAFLALAAVVVVDALLLEALYALLPEPGAG